MAAPPLKARELLQKLVEAGVEFTVVGGVAATIHGLDYTTTDLDVCAPLKNENLVRILAALGPLDPRQRMRPDRARLPATLATTTSLRNLYVETTLGWIDFLGEVSGIGNYEEVSKHSFTVKVMGLPIKVLKIDALIAAKEAAGRPKDQLSLPGLRKLRDLQDPTKSLFGPPPDDS